jgi:tetratricopeptide (TPR) repeat protein
MSQISDKPAKSNPLPVVNTEEEMNGLEKFFHALVPHASLIGLTLAALLLLFIALAWMYQTRVEMEEGQWITLTRRSGLFEVAGTTNILKEIAEEHPDSKAGLWALQFAGDRDLYNGLSKLASDRTEAIKEIEKAREAFRKIEEAPASLKSPELQRRSTYSLAYTYESLGQMDKAAELYRRLAEEAPESAFGKMAARGLARSRNPEFAAIYDFFKNWEDPTAPGPLSNDLPNIDFPEIPPIDNGSSEDQSSNDPPANSEQPPVAGQIEEAAEIRD